MLPLRTHTTRLDDDLNDDHLIQSACRPRKTYHEPEPSRPDFRSTFAKLHPFGGAYLYSSRVSVACGQQLDWRGVRHTRESCGDADPSGLIRESYAPTISIKSASDLDHHHMSWDFLEQNNSMSPLGAANNHVRSWQTSTLMTTLLSTPLLGRALFREAFDAVSRRG